MCSRTSPPAEVKWRRYNLASVSLGREGTATRRLEGLNFSGSSPPRDLLPRLEATRVLFLLYSLKTVVFGTEDFLCTVVAEPAV